MSSQELHVDFPPCILRFLEEVMDENALNDLQIKELRSAQQRVWLLEGFNFNVDFLPLEWRHALELGRNRLVAREWKASSCWWNLNHNQLTRDKGEAGISDVEMLARSEVAGYRIARQALTQMHIPNVLHFSLDSDVGGGSENPWAIFGYVGPDSSVFDNSAEDHTWMDGMVKTRLEFGFEEPHPR